MKYLGDVTTEVAKNLVGMGAALVVETGKPVIVKSGDGFYIVKDKKIKGKHENHRKDVRRANQ